MSDADGYSVAVDVDIRDIDPTLRPASLMRVGLSLEAVEEYAETLDRMPPVRLIFDRDAGTHWLVDGCHTINGAMRKRRRQVTAQIKEGTYLDAFREACRANDIHGVRVTNADKRRRVEEALKLDEVNAWSNRRIADWCGVHHQMVGHIRPEASQLDDSSSSKTVGKDGKARSAPKPKQPRKEPFVCHQCGEEFDHPVWHCPGCSEHWPLTDNACPKGCNLAHLHGGEAPEPEPEPDGDVAGGADEPGGFDEDAAWSRFRALADDELRSWPEDYRSSFVMNLNSYIARLNRQYGITTQEVTL